MNQFKKPNQFNINVCELLSHILEKANNVSHSFNTTVSTLSRDANMSTKRVRTSLDALIKTNEIRIDTSNNITKITVLKYDHYLIDSDPGKCQPSGNKSDVEHAETIVGQMTEVEQENVPLPKKPKTGQMPLVTSAQNEIIPVYAAEKITLRDVIEIKGKSKVKMNGQWFLQNNKKCILVNKFRIMSSLITFENTKSLSVIIENIWKHQNWNIKAGDHIADLVRFVNGKSL